MEGHSNIQDFEYLKSFQMTSQLFLLYFHFFLFPHLTLKQASNLLWFCHIH